MTPASWVVVRKSTGQAVLETYDKRVAAKVNRDAYTVLPILEYLYSLNREGAK